METVTKSWKTTLLGLAAGALSMYANGMSGKSALAATAIAAIGVFAKDGDVTHSQPKTE